MRNEEDFDLHNSGLPARDYARAIVHEAATVSSERARQLLGDISRSTLWRWVRDDASFPKPFRCQPTNPRARLKFFVSELVAWQRTKQADSALIRHTRVTDPKAAPASATE